MKQKKTSSPAQPLRKHVTIKGLNPLFPKAITSIWIVLGARRRHYIGALDNVVSVSIQPVLNVEPDGSPNAKSKWSVIIADHAGRTTLKSNPTRRGGIAPPNERVGFLQKHLSAKISDN